jgi:hypothetical protein
MSKRTRTGIGTPGPFPVGKLRFAPWRTHGKQSARARRRLGVVWPKASHALICRRAFASTHKEDRNVPIIRANAGIITQINVFTVPDGNQQALIDLLADSARFAKTVPGWISASLHRSLDGTRVVNYAQGESLEAAQRIFHRLNLAPMRSAIAS